jgi:kinesin family protein 6/9
VLQQRGGAGATAANAAGAAGAAAAAPRGGAGGEQEGAEQGELRTRVRKLALQVQQRDNEIAALIAMLPTGAGAGPPAAPPAAAPQEPETGDCGGGAARDSHGAADQEECPGAAGAKPAPARQQPQPPPQQPGQPQRSPRQQGGQPSWPPHEAPTAGAGAGAGQEVLSALLDVRLLDDRNRAFEVFRQSYSRNEVGPGGWLSRAAGRRAVGGAISKPTGSAQSCRPRLP